MRACASCSGISSFFLTGFFVLFSCLGACNSPSSETLTDAGIHDDGSGSGAADDGMNTNDSLQDGDSAPDVLDGGDSGLDASDGSGSEGDSVLYDGGQEDGGQEDGGLEDGGLEDGGLEDGGMEDGGSEDGGSDGSDASDVDPEEFCHVLDQPNELIADRRFRRGFIPLNQNTGQPEGFMPTGFCQADPVWSIAQWDSLGDLAQSARQTLSSGAVRWENQYGRVTIGQLQNPEADMAMAVWAFEEYGGQYHTPTPDRVWVHLLAEQRISPPGVDRPGCPPISSLDSLNFHLVARLLQDVPHYQAGYDSNKHAAQFLIYFTVQNLNPNSSGFGDYLWFGITPYDDRYDIVPTFIQGDLGGDMGTGKLIYNLGGEPFLSEGLVPGGPEETFVKDILPDVRQALLEAWDRGYLPASQDLSDYRIGGMNIGWEVPGLNDVEMQVRDLSLTYGKKSVVPVEFGFDSDGDTEGWTAYNMVDLNSDGPEGGLWILQVPGDDPYILSPELNLEAATHPTIHLLVANDHNPASSSTLRIYWDRFGSSGFWEARSVSVPVSNGGGWQTLNVDMSSNPEWSGEIAHIRIDPISSGDGHAVGFDEISFRP